MERMRGTIEQLQWQKTWLRLYVHDSPGHNPSNLAVCSITSSVLCAGISLCVIPAHMGLSTA